MFPTWLTNVLTQTHTKIIKWHICKDKKIKKNTCINAMQCFPIITPLSPPKMFSYNDMLYLLSSKKYHAMAKWYAPLISCL